MQLLPAILLGAFLADGTCARHDSEDNVCLLALNSSRSKLEANANGTSAVSSGLHNATELSLAGGNSQHGLGATLGTLVSDYRVRSARSAANRSGDRGLKAEVGAGASAGFREKSISVAGSMDQSAGGARAKDDHHSDGTDPAMEVSEEFQKRVNEAASVPAEVKNQEAHFYGKKTPPEPGESMSLNHTTAKMPSKAELTSTFNGKGTMTNSAADNMYFAKQLIQNGQSEDVATFKSGATELQTVIKTMYDLGRLIKRMPDDKLESHKETPSPTPPPYAYARRFEPFGKGSSTI